MKHLKPKWDEAPRWAMWLAMDDSGYWYWYEKAPSLGYSIWHNHQGGQQLRAAEPIFWDESLEVRP